MSLDEGGELAEFDGDNLPEKYVAGRRGGAWQQKLLDEVARQEARTSALWAQWGVPAIQSVPSFPGDGWYRLTRTFFREGFVSQTADGQPGCTTVLAEPPNPPDGWGRDTWDLGVLRVNTFPNYWSYIMSDHAAATRITPIDANRTHVRQYWMVHKDAQEGADFELERMKHVWHTTLLQDNELCAVNHAGVLSQAYSPGPYSPAKEAGVNYFTHGWYLPKFRGDKC
jgi:Rieske 2Fe-2S family protein